MTDKLIANLKEARLAKQLKQSDVAALLGVRKNTISNWENGKSNPDIDSLMLLCDIYGLSCSALLEDSYKTKNNNLSHVTEMEKNIILNYRKADEISKEIVFRALGIPSPKEATKKIANIS